VAAAGAAAAGSRTTTSATNDTSRHAVPHRKQSAYATAGRYAASRSAATALAPRPATLAATLETAKNRPRIVTGMARPMRSIQAGISNPPTPVTASSIPRRTASVAPGARSAIQYAAAASTRNGTRSQIVQRTRKGSLRASPSVYGAANRHGRNQPIVITAGIAPITTLGAPSHAANAGRMVDGEAKASATMNSA